MVEPSLSPGATARRLGIPAETLRSWDRRYGIGPSRRSAGGHRRYASEDLARLERMCRLISEGTAPAEAAAAALDVADLPWPGTARPTHHHQGRSDGNTLAVDGARPSCQGLERAATRLDAPLVEHLLGQSITQRGVPATWQDLAMPVLYGMGVKWARTRRYVDVEHLLSWTISTSLRRVLPSEQNLSEQRPVLLACVPDELHTLPLEALAATLTEQGIAHRMLGASLPTDAITAALRRTAPTALVLWSLVPTSTHDDSLRAALAVANTKQRRESTAVYTAGAGWPMRHRQGTNHLNSLPTALRVLACGTGLSDGEPFGRGGSR